MKESISIWTARIPWVSCEEAYSLINWSSLLYTEVSTDLYTSFMVMTNYKNKKQVTVEKGNLYSKA